MTDTFNERTADVPLAEDLLHGAAEIAEFIFGNARHRRKIYHLVQTSRLPVSRIGSHLCARRSVIREWIAAQESQSLGKRPPYLATQKI